MKKLFLRIIVFVVTFLSFFFGIIKPLDVIIIIQLLFIVLSVLGIVLTYTSSEFIYFPSNICKNIIAAIFVLISAVTILDFALELQEKILLKKAINSLYIYIASISIIVLSIILGLINGYNSKKL